MMETPNIQKSAEKEVPSGERKTSQGEQEVEITHIHHSETAETLRVMECFQQEVGEPIIEPLDRVKLRMGDVLKSLVKTIQTHEGIKEQLQEWSAKLQTLERIAPKSLQKILAYASNPRSSAWAIYAYLNLEAHKTEHRIPPQAVRFCHTMAVEEKLDLSQDENIARALRESREGDARFPWIDTDGEVFYDDPRCKDVKFHDPLIVRSPDGFSQKNDPLQPVVFICENPQETKNKEYIRRQMDRCPFMIVVHNDHFLILSNHEYFDGIFAAHLLHTFIEKLGMKPKDLKNIERDKLVEYFQATDDIENAYGDGTERYKTKTTVLSDNLVELLNKEYKRIDDTLKDKYGVGGGLSYDAFIQLFIMATNHVDGRVTRGGVLKFSQKITEQLGHIDIGDAEELYYRLSHGDKDHLKEFLQSKAYLMKSSAGTEYVNIFRNATFDNINTLIGGLRLTPKWLWNVLNALSKGGAAKAIAGQVMTSVVPENILLTTKLGLPDSHGKRKPIREALPLGGSGGPACTEYQDAAFTVTVLMGEDGSGKEDKVVGVIVKRKYKKER